MGKGRLGTSVPRPRTTYIKRTKNGRRRHEHKHHLEHLQTTSLTLPRPTHSIKSHQVKHQVTMVQPQNQKNATKKKKQNLDNQAKKSMNWTNYRHFQK